MTLDELRALYDQQIRIELESAGFRLEAFPHLVRAISTSGGRCWIGYSKLDKMNVDSVIQEQIRTFNELGQDVEWTVYDYDTPSNLKERLVEHGFEMEEAEAVLVLDVQAVLEDFLATTHSAIRPITTSIEIDEIITMLETVWQEDKSSLATGLKVLLQEAPDTVSFYGAYMDNRLVSAAWIRFDGDNQFASLWGGSTLPDYRKKGLYSALLAIRAREAIKRSKRFLTVDASPMSRPILEKYGFQAIAIAIPCTLRVQNSSKV